ncbi:cell division protein ZapB [Vibrio sp. SS-MA-C1-2]|uniref:cell division protein ZapB n=1 Tax=Vibrio sp. SS-MA-C1-2 TaxID=2908646 RepID=UPI001F01FCD1|nr:cell division protein ZapB [Vibrio sp. SS-MA-C1-2]UJF19247.1 cell division protein ZapB [Vibrio sp. SS-MA-C1-2]
MTFEVLEKLETKVQMAVDTIALLQMEIEELKSANEELVQEAGALRENKTHLEQSNAEMQQEHAAWQDRLQGLLGKMADVE